MAASAWSKLALLLCYFGLKAFVFGIVAENKKPQFGTGTVIGDGYVMCEFSRLSVVMGILSVISLLIAILIGHRAVFYPYPTNRTSQQPATVPRRALLRSTILIVFFIIAEVVSVSALVMLVKVTKAEAANLRYQQPMQPDGTMSCPSMTGKMDGHFGGGALLALDAALIWFVCQLLALEARANYLDRLPGDDEEDEENNKKHDGDIVASPDHSQLA
ncbi:hypothetical protein CFC21_045040 [Triticum aestivum]|uniref:Uncharacterized protein n=3 Tax=Triticum TaxID=4564 RepID=A0A9R1JYA6_WHEAT|nr:hypothetical protein CFC21_045040 [Triticum aestivum]CDM87170.1 unnamed protein product [Triticum aestivum]VAH86689.1 unnamed protein product [Triticum turgidum subsp. durum]